MTKSHRVNIKEEKGYHSAMINYDELWRAINSYFYEVDVTKAKLKYGDLVVFSTFQRTLLKKQISGGFVTLLHTSLMTILSQRDQNPNSPYTIKTLSDDGRPGKHILVI